MNGVVRRSVCFDPENWVILERKRRDEDAVVSRVVNRALREHFAAEDARKRRTAGPTPRPSSQ